MRKFLENKSDIAFLSKKPYNTPEALLEDGDSLMYKNKSTNKQ